MPPLTIDAQREVLLAVMQSDIGLAAFFLVLVSLMFTRGSKSATRDNLQAHNWGEVIAMFAWFGAIPIVMCALNAVQVVDWLSRGQQGTHNPEIGSYSQILWWFKLALATSGSFSVLAVMAMGITARCKT